MHVLGGQAAAATAAAGWRAKPAAVAVTSDVVAVWPRIIGLVCVCAPCVQVFCAGGRAWAAGVRACGAESLERRPAGPVWFLLVSLAQSSCCRSCVCISCKTTTCDTVKAVYAGLVLAIRVYRTDLFRVYRTDLLGYQYTDG
jgi:hypothetical protein